MERTRFGGSATRSKEEREGNFLLPSLAKLCKGGEWASPIRLSCDAQELNSCEISCAFCVPLVPLVLPPLLVLLSGHLHNIVIAVDPSVVVRIHDVHNWRQQCTGRAAVVAPTV